MKPTPLLVLLLVAVVTAACTRHSGAPSAADARAALEQDIQDFSQGCIKLVAIKTTGEHELASVMVVNASAEIEFLEDCTWPIETLVVALKTADGQTPNVKKGEHRTVHLTLQFHKTAQGWKPTQKKDPGSKAAP